MNGNRNNDTRQRPAGGGKDVRARAPETTYEEVRYIKYLIENHVPVRVRLLDNEEVAGTIEYYDASFIRITRERYTRSSLRRFWMIHACVSYSISFAHPASSSRSEPWTAMKKRKRGGLWVTPRLEWSSEPIASLPPQGIAHTMSRHVRSLPAPVILTI